VPVRIFQTLTDGFRESPFEPFIVRNCQSFGALNVRAALERVAQSDFPCFGYDKVDGCTVENIQFSRLYEDWKAD